jgi:hypothetical protein
MRSLTTRILACAVCVLAPVSVLGQPQAPPRPAGECDQPVTAHELARLMNLHVPPSLEWDKEAAGLPETSHPEFLTWERVYALALVRARGAPGPRAEALDPKALAEKGKQYGIADFGRFRKEFLAPHRDGSEGFHDPSDHFLALLAELKQIDHARLIAEFHENVIRLMSELAKGESGSVSQLILDQAEAASVTARRSLSREVAAYRNHLEAFKVALGLSVHAPVVLDRETLASFGRVSDQVRDWQGRPDRHHRELPQIIKRLPALGEILVEGRPTLELMGGGADQQEEVLTRAARVAIQNRSARAPGQDPGDPDVVIELKVRRRIRGLFETRRDYEAQQRSYEMSTRALDQGLEQSIAPSAGGALVNTARIATAVTGMLAPEKHRTSAEDRLVALWTSFQTERLALYRDLGILPYDDWKSFWNDLSAR